MNIKTPKFLNGIFAIWLLLSGLITIFITQPALADTATDNANTFCANKNSSNKNPNGINKSDKDACIIGYEAGYNKVAVTVATCHRKVSHNESTSQYKACTEGYVSGKNQRASDDTPSGGSGSTAGKNDCAGVTTYFKFDCSGKSTDKGGNDNPIIALLLTALSWMTGLISLVVVGGIVWGGILYTTAQDNSAQTKKGIMFIVDSVIGLLLWFSAYALINFVIPGGLFN